MDHRRIIPTADSILQAGFTRTGREITKTVSEQISTINPEDINTIMRFIRRKVYLAGLVNPQKIKAEAHIEACQEQHREQLYDPINQEGAEKFKQRVTFWINTLIIRHLTLAPTETSREILGEARARFRESAESERIKNIILTRNPKTGSIEINQNNIDILAIPLDIALDIIALTENQALINELPEDEKTTIMAMAEEAHSQLITRLLTNNPEMIDIGQKYFKYKDYIRILRCSPGDLGEGEIGNKAVGIEMARIILETPMPEFDEGFEAKYITANCKSESDKQLNIKRWRQFLERTLEHNESYHIGARTLQELINFNPELSKLHILKRIYLQNPEKYEETQITKQMHEAKFPKYIEQHLRELYEKMITEFEGAPIIVRSSSDLEDRGGNKQKGASFAGQYESVVCSGKAEGFEEFIKAIKTVYASVYAKTVFEYRKDNGLINDFEKMGILIQKLNGERYGKYFFPEYAGVILSHSLNSMGADPKKGQVKICTGLANTVVDNRGGRDILFDSPAHNPYPEYKQEKLFAVNLETGLLEEVETTKAVEGLNNTDLISKQKDYSDPTKKETRTADLKGLLQNSKCSFLRLLQYYMEKLRYALVYNVDIEFTAKRITEDGKTKYKIKIVQCRPQAFNEKIKPTIVPETTTPKRTLFEIPNKLNCGSAVNIEYIMYIDPKCYTPNTQDTHNTQKEEPTEEQTQLDFQTFKNLNKWISKINEKLKNNNWGLIAPGRLGDNPTSELGISAKFHDYKNAQFIMEITGGNWHGVPPSSGSHDAQLIAEKGMLVLGCEFSQNEEEAQRTPFFNVINTGENLIKTLCPEIPDELLRWIKVIDIKKEGANHKIENCRLHIAAFNGDGGKATLYLAEKDKDLPQAKMM